MQDGDDVRGEARAGQQDRQARARPHGGEFGSLADRMISVVRLIGAVSGRKEIAGLSNARYELLHTVVHAGPARMGTIARHLGYSPRTLTPMVDALEAEGLLRREPDPTDRRAQRLELTPSGYELMHRAHDERLSMATGVFSALDPEERVTLSRLLDKILAGAGDYQPTASD
jgi:DNA-binding MarR family transcriptional regulator